MIKYYCDKCKEEITSDRATLKIRCRALIGPTELNLIMHKACAAELIGAEAIEAEAKRMEEYLERAAARKAAREKNEVPQQKDNS